MSESCPADANVEEKRLHDGQEKPQSDPLSSLAGALLEMAQAIRENSKLMLEIAEEQSALIHLLVTDQADPEDEEPAVDMAGNPIRAER